MKQNTLRALLSSAMMVGFATAASAQLPSASTRALGMGDNFTAAARGFAAVSWNPAMLGLPGQPGASFTLLPVRGVAGLGPVKLKDFANYSNKDVPDAVRQQWLNSIQQKGSEQGTGGGDVTFLGLQIGKVAFQVGSEARAIANLSPGAAQLLFFGNAGRTGQPEAISLNNSKILGSVETTGALSFAIPVSKSATSNAAIGITAKYTVGHGLIVGQDQGSNVTADPNVSVTFPVVMPNTDNYKPNNGNGFGLDVGFAMKNGATTFGATVRNVVNSFKWDVSKLAYRPGTATFNSTTKTSNFDQKAYATAPAALQTLVSDAKYKPVISVGLARELSSRLTLTADGRMRAGDQTIEDDPKMHIGAGAEFRAIPILPIRVGAAVVTGGYQIGGGLGLNLGPLNLGASLASRKGDLGTDVITMFTVISTIGK